MSLGEDLLIILSSYSGGYRLMRRRIMGDTRPARFKSFKRATDASVRVTLSRLKQRGLIENKNGLWKITERGIKRLASGIFRKSHTRRKKSGNKNISNSRHLIIAFDIPEAQRGKRDWLRIELHCLGFKMLQKSLWFGPAPLPREFILAVKELHIMQFMKFFEAKESDIV